MAVGIGLRGPPPGVRIVSFAVIFFLIVPSLASESWWWNENWERRRPIFISGLCPENIHLKIVLPYDGDMQPDFRDLRFLENENSGLLNFWVENYTSENATIWVRRLENLDSVIYVYYGNPEASSVSSWENTILPYSDILATGSAAWSARYGHTSVVFGGKVWVIGGGAEDDNNDVWKSADGVTWTAATENGGWTPRKNHTSVVFDGKMWVMGGVDSGVWYSENGENWVLATSTPGWSARWGHTSIVFNNRIWVIGGYDGSYKNDVWYSSDGVGWTLATSSAPWSGRHSHASAVFDNRMWVIGGYSSGVFKNDVWYSSDGENWFLATGNGGWTPRRNHTAVVFDNRMWVIGGNGELWAEYLSDVWYSENGSIWTEVTGSTWSARYEHASVVFNNTVWVIGGYDGSYKNDAWRLLRKIVLPPPGVEIGEEEPGWHLRENWNVIINAWWRFVESWSATIIAEPYLGWFPVESWSATINAPIPAPTLLSPPNGSRTSDSTPTFDWDNLLPTDNFQVQIDDHSDFSSPAIDVITTASEFTPTAALPDGVYSWRVLAFRNGENSAWTDTWSLRISTAVPKTNTTLSLTPSNFSLTSGSSFTFSAVLRRADGAQLLGKSITWSASAGSLSPTTGITDENGKVAVTYTAPLVTENRSVTITASFAGDALYNGSQGTSTGTIFPTLPAQTVVKIKPESFRVRAGDVLEIVAVLTTKDGTALSGKHVTWRTSAGRIEAKSRATDALGEVWAKFFAPDNVENDLTVTITASFAGDEDFLPSQENSKGVVVPKTLPKTTLTIVPASFNMGPENTQELRARLTTEAGARLAGKPIQWCVDVGEIIPEDNLTDTQGEVRAIYRSPAVNLNTSVTIIATFPGDDDYCPSAGVSRGAVLLPEVKQALDNLQGATREVGDIQAIEENLVFLRDAVIKGDVAAAVTIGKEPGLSRTSFLHENAGVVVKEVRERKAVVEVDSDRGRTILLNVENEVLPVLAEEIEVRVDNEKIELADDYADALDPTNDGDREEYLILRGAKGIQVLVSIPHFSVRTITISTLPTVPIPGFPSLYVVGVAMIVLVIVVLAVIWKRIRTGAKMLSASSPTPPTAGSS